MAPGKEWLKAQRQTLGARLRAQRQAEGLTQDGFAQALALGRYERTSIAHIEAGNQPAPRPFWQRADALLRAGGALLAGFDELDRARQTHEQDVRERARADRIVEAQSAQEGEPSWAPNLGEALVDVLSSWQRPMAPSAFVVPGDGAALQWLLHLSPADRPFRTQGGRRIGVGEVIGIRVMRAHLKGIDNSLGGGAALPMMLTYLRHSIPTLLNSQYSEPVGRALMAAIAELTLDLGWMAYDSGKQPEARRHMLRALRLSHASGDRLTRKSSRGRACSCPR